MINHVKNSTELSPITDAIVQKRIMGY